jgi:hypothetical protein
LQAYSGDPTFAHSLLVECMNAIHWGRNVEAHNSQVNILLASSLVVFEFRVRFPAETCLSLVKYIHRTSNNHYLALFVETRGGGTMGWECHCVCATVSCVQSK